MYKFLDEGKKHVHILDGSPLYGTSTVCSILAKELTWWASGMAVGTLGWTATQSDADMRLEVATAALEELKKLDPPAYLKRLDLAYKAHSDVKNKAATKGVDLHSLLESYVKSCIENNQGEPLSGQWENPLVDKFKDWAIKNVEKFLFSEGHTYSKKHHLGGIVDAGARMKSGRTAIVDFKSAKAVYYGHMVQCAGYAIQVEETGIVTAEGTPVLEPISIDELTVIPFGSEKMEARSVQNIEGFKEAFLGALTNYKLNQAFNEK